MGREGKGGKKELLSHGSEPLGPGKEAFSGTLLPLFCVSVISHLTFLYELKGESFVLSSIYFQVSHIELSGIASFSLVSKSLWDESEAFLKSYY